MSGKIVKFFIVIGISIVGHHSRAQWLSRGSEETDTNIHFNTGATGRAPVYGLGLSAIKMKKPVMDKLRDAALSAGIERSQYDKLMGYAKKYAAFIPNRTYVSFIDFSLPSTQERLFVVNTKTAIITKHLVAHGKNSGEMYANSFSNVDGSLKSSLGLYQVQTEYNGKHGPSLILAGLEAQNSNALTRNIVMHAAAYVSKNFIATKGFLGRSWGCPAINPEEWLGPGPKASASLLRADKPTLGLKDKLKNGSLLLIYKLK